MEIRIPQWAQNGSKRLKNHVAMQCREIRPLTPFPMICFNFDLCPLKTYEVRFAPEIIKGNRRSIMADKTQITFFLDDVGPYATGVPGREKELVPVDAAALTEFMEFLKDRSLAGLLLLQGAFKTEEEKEIIDLFTEPLGTYIDNRLLSRKLEEKANTDPLTRLYNRAYLDQAIIEETEKRQKLNMDFSVVVADINRLKKANDLYGHEAGDRLILTVSELLCGKQPGIWT